jgi:hypothetical protein
MYASVLKTSVLLRDTAVYESFLLKATKNENQQPKPMPDEVAGWTEVHKKYETTEEMAFFRGIWHFLGICID